MRNYYYSSRILEIPCKVCGDNSSGKHYNIYACDGCAGFFKRSIRKSSRYQCKENQNCLIDKKHRNQCRACRLNRCIEVGMNKDAVQHERGPRNSTKKQAIYYNNNYTNKTEDLMSRAHLLSMRYPESQSVNMSFPFFPPEQLCRNLLAMHAFSGTMLPLPLILPPASIDTNALRESAAKVLLGVLLYVKKVTTNNSLPLPDQILLLERSWKELFVLSTPEFLTDVKLTAFVNSSEIMQMEPVHADFMGQVQKFRNILCFINSLILDSTELLYLKAIILFRTSVDEKSDTSSTHSNTEIKILSNAERVAEIEQEMDFALRRYLNTKPAQALKFGHIMYLLRSLKEVSDWVIVELFFRKSIGDSPFVTVMCDLYAHYP